MAGTSVSWLLQMPEPAAHPKMTGPGATDKLRHSQSLVLHLPAEATAGSPTVSASSPLSVLRPRRGQMLCHDMKDGGKTNQGCVLHLSVRKPVSVSVGQVSICQSMFPEAQVLGTVNKSPLKEAICLGNVVLNRVTANFSEPLLM